MQAEIALILNALVLDCKGRDHCFYHVNAVGSLGFFDIFFSSLFFDFFFLWIEKHERSAYRFGCSEITAEERVSLGAST